MDAEAPRATGARCDADRIPGTATRMKVQGLLYVLVEGRYATAAAMTPNQDLTDAIREGS
jgi:hypothetical protein